MNTSLKDEIKQALREIKREDEAKALHTEVHNFIYQKLGKTPEGMIGLCECGICGEILRYNTGQNAFASL